MNLVDVEDNHEPVTVGPVVNSHALSCQLPNPAPALMAAHWRVAPVRAEVGPSPLGEVFHDT